MKVYKMFRVVKGELHPLYVEATRKMALNEWLFAGVGQLVDETHVKASGCGGKLALRPGFHSCEVPYTDWIGKKGDDGKLLQRKNTVWCECEVEGDQIIVTDRRGLRTLPNGWYYYKTNSKQDKPWIISDKIKINKVLDREEVIRICKDHGYEAQAMEA